VLGDELPVALLQGVEDRRPALALRSGPCGGPQTMAGSTIFAKAAQRASEVASFRNQETVYLIRHAFPDRRASETHHR
jgi:hypothetical protein